MVKIILRGPIATRLQKSELDISIDTPLKLEDLLKRVLDEVEEVHEVWTDVHSMEREALILKNEVDIGVSNGLETMIEDNDSIVILPLIHGG